MKRHSERCWRCCCAVRWSPAPAAATTTTTRSARRAPTAPPAQVPDGPAISIGAQDFGESAILAEIYRQALDQAGFEAAVTERRRLPRPALRRVRVGRRQPRPRLRGLRARVPQRLRRRGHQRRRRDLRPSSSRCSTEKGLEASTPSEAVDTNAFAVTKETAEDLGLETLSDLEKDEDLTLGGLPGLRGERVLPARPRAGLRRRPSANFTPLDPTLVGDALSSGDIDVGVITSTDGRIDEEGWVVLEDDKHDAGRRQRRSRVHPGAGRRLRRHALRRARRGQRQLTTEEPDRTQQAVRRRQGRPRRHRRGVAEGQR